MATQATNSADMRKMIEKCKLHKFLFDSAEGGGGRKMSKK